MTSQKEPRANVPSTVNDAIRLNIFILHTHPILTIWPRVKNNLASLINLRGKSTRINPSIRFRILKRIDIPISNSRQEPIVLLPRPIEVRHSFIALIQEDVRAAESIIRKPANVLIHADLRACQEPQHALNDEVGNEPA